MSTSPLNSSIQHGHIGAQPLVKKAKPAPAPKAPAPAPAPPKIGMVDAPTMQWTEKLEPPKPKEIVTPVAQIDVSSVTQPVAQPVAKQVSKPKVETPAIPDEIRALKWSWGAMVVPFWWLLFHRFFGSAIAYYIAVYCLYALVLPLQQHFLGASFVWLPYVMSNGIPSVFTALAAHKIAWKRGNYTSVAQYINIEKRWTVIGVIFNVVALGAVYFIRSHH